MTDLFHVWTCCHSKVFNIPSAKWYMMQALPPSTMPKVCSIFIWYRYSNKFIGGAGCDFDYDFGPYLYEGD